MSHRQLRFLLFAIALVLAACAPAPAPTATSAPQPTATISQFRLRACSRSYCDLGAATHGHDQPVPQPDRSL